MNIQVLYNSHNSSAFGCFSTLTSLTFFILFALVLSAHVWACVLCLGVNNNNNNNNSNNGLLTDPQIFSSYSYLGQLVLLCHISVYCREQIKLLLLSWSGSSCFSTSGQNSTEV